MDEYQQELVKLVDRFDPMLINMSSTMLYLAQELPDGIVGQQIASMVMRGFEALLQQEGRSLDDLRVALPAVRNVQKTLAMLHSADRTPTTTGDAEALLARFRQS